MRGRVRHPAAYVIGTQKGGDYGSSQPHQQHDGDDDER